MFLIKLVVNGKKNSVLPRKLVQSNDILETLRVIWKHCEEIICQQIRQYKKIDKYLETYNLPIMNHEE